jgi:hypothetical protein
VFRRAQPSLDGVFVGVRLDFHRHLDVLEASAAVFLTSECRLIEFTLDGEVEVINI